MRRKKTITAAVLCAAMLCGCSAEKLVKLGKKSSDVLTIARTASQTKCVKFSGLTKVDETDSGDVIEQFSVKNSGAKTLSFIGTLSAKYTGTNNSGAQLISARKQLELSQRSEDVKAGSLALHSDYWAGESKGTPFVVTRLKPGEKRTYQMTFTPTDSSNLPAKDRALSALQFSTADPYKPVRKDNQTTADYNAVKKQTLSTMKAYTDEAHKIKVTMDNQYGLEGTVKNGTNKKIKKAYLYFSFSDGKNAHPEACIVRNIGAKKTISYKGSLENVLGRSDYGCDVIGYGSPVDDESGNFAGSLNRVVYYV